MSKGKIDLISGRKLWMLGDEITENSYLCLNLNDTINYFGRNGYCVNETDVYKKNPIENECLVFPNKYNSIQCKILKNDKVVTIRSILSILRFSTEDSLKELLNVKELTRDILENVVDIINKSGINTTTASKSIGDFLKNYNFDVCPDNIDLENYTACGYLYNNSMNNVVRDSYVYDINSYFPFIASNLSIPYKEKVILKKANYESIKNEVYFTKCCIVSATLKDGRMPLQYTSGGDSIHLFKSRGNIMTILSNLDVDYLYDNYENVDIRFGKTIIYYTAENIFKDYINELFKEKSSASNPIEYRISKLKINSFIGKFGSKYKHSGGYTNRPLHRYILSYSRINLCNIINNIINKYGKDSFYYSDTDSIHCSLTPRQFKEFCKIGTELGEFKLEHHYDFCWYEDKYKSYVGLENGEIVYKLAGIPQENREPYKNEFLEKINKLV